MSDIEEQIEAWRTALLKSIPVGGLISRNPIVYKWKSLFRVWMLREAVSWRTQDLLAQSCLLHRFGHDIGARILLRSAFETVAMLIYLNSQIQKLLDGKITFNDFGDLTSVLLLGSRVDDSAPKAKNISTILEKCEQRYPGIGSLYASLSETAHPNYEGLCGGYTKIDHSEFETVFSNRWVERYGENHLNQVKLCMDTFLIEYDQAWVEMIEKLETWVEANDAALEASRVA